MVFISTLMIASSTSWVIVWATLELNTLVMCFLISKETKQVKDTINPAAMYFLIQAIASIVLVTTMVSKSSEWKTLLALMSLSLKMGVWPVHSWYLKLIPSLKFHSSSMALVMTWQKIAPLILLSMLPSFNAIITLALLTMVLPLLSLSGPLGMKPLMATSSVSNSGWLLMCSVLSPLTLCMFFAQYSASVVMSLKFLNNNSSKEKTTPKNFIGSTIILGNMGGVPPLIMFTAKIMVIKNFLEKTSSTVLPVIMLISSCALLYFYCWALSEMIMLKPKKSQNPYTDSPWLAGAALVMSVPPLLLLILG